MFRRWRVCVSIATTLAISLRPTQTHASVPELFVGDAGWALEFDGVDDFAHILRELPCPNVTIELWAKPFTRVDAVGRPVLRHNPQGTLLSRYLPEHLLALAYDGRATYTSVGEGLAAHMFPEATSQTWHHWALVSQGDQWTSYLDGVPSGTLQLTSAKDWEMLCKASLLSFPWMLGGRSPHPGGAKAQSDLLFGGHIDEVRWWSKALSVSEIKKWMMLAPKADEPGLFQRWGFDVQLSRSAGMDDAGLSIGAEQEQRSPAYVRSTLPMVGTPVVINVLADGKAVTERLCAALTPPVSNAQVSAHFTWPGGQRLGLLRPAQADDTSNDSFIMEMLPELPWLQGGDSVITLFCSNVSFIPQIVGRTVLNYTVRAELPGQSVRLEETGVLDIQVRPSLPPVAGRATALSLEGQAYASLGVWELPATETNASFAFSVWVDPYIVAEGTCILSRQTTSGERIFLFGYLRGRYYIWMDCRDTCNGDEASTQGEMFFPPLPEQEGLSQGKEVLQVLRERDKPHLLAVSMWCNSRGNADIPASLTAEMYVDGHSIGVVEASTCWHSNTTWVDNEPQRMSPWILGAQLESGDRHRHVSGLGQDGQGSGFFHGLLDDLCFWQRALTPADVRMLAEGRFEFNEDLIVRYTFDLEPPAICRDRQLVEPGIQCFPLGDTEGMAANSSGVASFLVGGGTFLPSPFFKLPGSPLHRAMPQDECAEIELQGADPHGGVPIFRLAGLGAQLPVSLTGSRLRHCATDLGSLEVPFDACNDWGQCASGTSGLGLAVFQILQRGPQIQVAQSHVDLYGLITFRIVFSEVTNAPRMEDLDSLHRMLHVDTPLDMNMELAGGGWEWNPFQVLPGARVLRVNLKADLDVQIGLAMGAFDGIVFRVKKEGLIRNQGETSFPSTSSTTNLVNLNCSRGQQLIPNEVECKHCNSGEFSEPGLSGPTCNMCPPGRYQPDTGQSSCIGCPVGRFQEWDWSTSCESCGAVLPGSATVYEASANQDACVCPEGSTWFKTTPAAPAVCRKCGQGLHCPGGRLAPSETLRKFYTTEPHGLGYNYSQNHLPEHQTPQQQAGFSAGAPGWQGGPPSYIARCRSVLGCPQGLQLGTCPPLQHGRACDFCLPGSYPSGFACKPCDSPEDSAVLAYSYACVLAMAFVLALYLLGTRKPSIFWKPSVTIAIGFSISFSAVQVLGSLVTMDDIWPEPMPTLKAWLGILVLDVENQRLPCILGSYGPVGSYLGTLAIYPSMALLLTMVLLASQLCPQWRISLSQSLNMHGAGLMSVFTSISVVAMAPLKCRSNPDGTSAPESYRSVICWNSEGTDHLVMVAASILALLLIVVSFLAVLLWATLVYPSRISQPGGGEHVIRFKFLFGACIPQRYYFGFLLGLRKLFIALAPMLVVDQPSAQLMMVMLVIACNMALECSLWPWRTYSGNLLDACTALLLIMLISAGFELGDFDSDQRHVVGKLMVLSTLAAGVALFCVSLAHCAMRLLIRKRSYSIFLSHHKVGAGLLARWMKLLLRDLGQTRVFLDSDDLRQLDMLMDIVAHDCENVVVLLTRETLSRPWCAMELAAAFKSNTRVVPVICDGFTGISDAFLDSLATLWSAEQLTTMAAGGISPSDVRSAYEALRGAPPVLLSRTGADVQHHLAAVKEILARCSRISKEEAAQPRAHAGSADKVADQISGTLSALSASASAGKARMALSIAAPVNAVFSSLWTGVRSNPSHESGQNSCKVAILNDMIIDEFACACRVLQVLLQELVQESVAVKSSYTGLTASFVLVVMRPGALRELNTAEAVVVAAKDPGVELVPLLVDEFTEFPTAQFWADLAAGRVLKPADLLLHGLSIPEVENAYKRLFNTLAVKFSGHGSNDIQTVEVQAMASRIKSCLKSAPLAPPSSVGVETLGRSRPASDDKYATEASSHTICDQTWTVHQHL